MRINIVLALALVFLSQPLRGDENGRIAGRVVDGQDRPISGATIVVCDAQTGIPLERGSFDPVVKSMKFQQIASASSDRDGRFSIVEVKAGVYRLIAQSWEGARQPVKSVLDVNGVNVRLHGVAASVRVPSGAATQVTIRPLGSATLDITTAPKAPNNETLLIVSTAPLAADPVLGLAAWSGPFVPNMVSGNRMPMGRTTIQGLPSGAVHVAAFAADNNPGFGGLSRKLQDGQTTYVSIPLIASWSDGYKTPPDELKELVVEVRGMSREAVLKVIQDQIPDVRRAIETSRTGRNNPWTLWVPFLDRQVKLPNGRTDLVKNVMAAVGYAELVRSAESRILRRKRDQLKSANVDSGVTYEQALRDLHERLGQSYPCFAIKGIDWDGVGRRLLPLARTAKSDADFGLLCLQMVAALEDSHAQLQSAAAQVPKIPFAAWDAGFACLMDERGKPVIYSVSPKSSAESSGLEIGMTVVRIDGVEASLAIRKTMDHLSRYIGYSSERYLRYHACRFFARQAESNTEFKLTVIDANGQRTTRTLRAAQKVGYLPRLPVPVAGISDTRDVSWKMLSDDIGYVYVRRIPASLIESLDQAVAQLKSARGLIIDVRGNSGGGFDAQRSHRNFDPADSAEPERPRFSGPIALLIDARCISAGEGWASWFVARDRATLFGETTAGASARKTTYVMKNGLFRVRYPVKAYKGYLDRPIEHLGLVPDVAVMPTARDIAAGKDTVLEAAKRHLIAEFDRIPKS